MHNAVVIKSSKAGMTVILDPDLPFGELLEAIGKKFRESARFWGSVQMTLTLEGRDLEKEIASYQAMHDAYPDMILCASHGLVKLGDLKRMHEAGSHVSYQCGNLGAVLSGNLYHAHL